MTDKNFKEPYFIAANSSEFLANGETWIENNQRFRQSQKFEFYRNAVDFIFAVISLVFIFNLPTTAPELSRR